MQDCFESRDIAQLQTVLSAMPRDDAARYLDLCIKSGLWVPNAKDAEADGQDEPQDDQAEESANVAGDVSNLQIKP